MFLSYDEYYSLNEKMKAPDTSFVHKFLDRAKFALLKAKSNVECAKILRDIFRTKWIRVRTTNKGPDECTDAEWNISGGSAEKDERKEDKTVATIDLGKNFYKRIKDAKTIGTWNAFCASFETTVAHEYVHKYQIKFIPDETISRTWANKAGTDYDKYLQIKQEIQAYAYGALKEFIAKGYTPEEVMERIKKPIDPKVIPAAEASNSYMKYMKFYTHDPKTFKRFLKYMYDFTSQFIEK